MKKYIFALVIFFLTLYIYVSYIQKRSLSSFLIEKYFYMTNAKKYFEYRSEDELKKLLDESMKNTDKRYVPTKISYEIEDKDLHNMQVLVWNDKKDKNQKVIFYLHGGTYINNLGAYHFKSLDNISRKADAKVILPIYKKAPRYSYKDAIKELLQLYNTVLQETNAENISIMGDSAGGGLALALAFEIRDNNLEKAKNLILLSPFLDVNLDNEMIAEYEKKDSFLSSWLAREVGKIWSENDTKNPLVSPIYGHFENLSKMYIFTGTHDILYPDILKFSKILKENNIEHELITKDKMNHVYVVYPIPEAVQAQDMIYKIISEKGVY